MKKYLYYLSTISFFSGYSALHAKEVQLTIQNNSRYSIWAVSHGQTPCAGIVSNPWINEKYYEVCGHTDTKNPIQTRQSGTMTLHGKDSYKVTIWTNETDTNMQRSWNIDINARTKQQTINFPDDFKMIEPDKQRLKQSSSGWTVYPLMASGTFGTISNYTTLSFTVPLSNNQILTLPANIKNFDAANNFKLGSTGFFGGNATQPAMWNDQKNIVFQSQPNGVTMNITFSFNEAANSLSITSQVTQGSSSGSNANQNVFTANSSILYFNTLLANLNIPQTATNQIHYWKLSFSISPNNDYKVVVDKIEVVQRYVDGTHPQGTTKTITLNNSQLKAKQILFEQ